MEAITNTRSKVRTKMWLPREHGAWAMFVVPLLVGIGASGKWNVNLPLLALTVSGFFLLRYPLMLAVKSRAFDTRREVLRWSLIYTALTAISGGWLLLASQLWLLLPIGALGLVTLVIYLLLATRRAEMSTAGEWLGVAGLALGAPAAYLVATRVLDTTAVVVYLLNVLFFGGTVLYIKFKVREQSRTVTLTSKWFQKLWAGRATILYHTLVLIAVVLLAANGIVPALVVAAFALPMCKVVQGVLTRPSRLNIPRLGLIELVITATFTFIVLVAYH